MQVAKKSKGRGVNGKGRGLRRGGAAPIIILLVILVAAAAVFVFMRSRGPSMQDYRNAVAEQSLLNQTLADANTFFDSESPRKLPQSESDPRDEEGNLVPPTADEYVYTVEAGGETMYVKIRVSRSTGKILSVRETDSEGNEL